jgi:hypothetical protein
MPNQLLLSLCLCLCMWITGSFRTQRGPIRLRAANKCIDINPVTSGTRAQIWDCNNSAYQANFLRPAFSMTLQFNGLCLDAFGSGTANGSPVGLYTCNGTPNQSWFFDSEDRLRPLYAPHKCLDIPGGDTTNGVKLQLWDCNDSNAQKWTV